MTLQQLRYLLEISRCGSITEAAKRLYIAQPSLSKTIKDLEEEFHIEIFKRGRHGITFTAEGEEFLRYAQRVLDATESMMNYFKDEEASKEEVHLSISSQHYMFVVDALIDFMSNVIEETKYTLQIREVRTSQVIEDVLQQKSQIGILYVTKLTEKYMEGVFRKHNLEFTSFYDFPPYVYLATTHPLAQKKIIELEDLKHYPYVRYEQGVDPYQFSEELVLPQIYSKQSIAVTDRSTMLSIIGNTKAYNIGTGCILPRITGGKVKAIALADNYGQMRIGWIRKKSLPMKKEIISYVDYMQKSLQKVALEHACSSPGDI